jgi:hypothetical protein
LRQEITKIKGKRKKRSDTPADSFTSEDIFQQILQGAAIEIVGATLDGAR